MYQNENFWYFDIKNFPWVCLYSSPCYAIPFIFFSSVFLPSSSRNNSKVFAFWRANILFIKLSTFTAMKQQTFARTKMPNNSLWFRSLFSNMFSNLFPRLCFMFYVFSFFEILQIPFNANCSFALAKFLYRWLIFQTVVWNCYHIGQVY